MNTIPGTPWRQQFFVPAGGPYVLSHSAGCQMRSASLALDAGFLEPWRERGGEAWPLWLAALEEFRAALATLLGGCAADYCPQSNVTSGLAKVLGALPAPPAGRSVVLASEECFPSLAFAIMRARGYSLRFMPRGESPERFEHWRRALDAPDLCAVLITHVHSATGVVGPVREIAAACRGRGLISIVDVAQSVGVLPIDVAALGADVLLGSCLKWLCGGPGAGFLWVRPSLIDSLEPSDVGWFSHEEPFEFDCHDFRYAKDARRFWGGTPSVAPFVVAAAAIRRLAGVGIEAVRAHNLHLQRLLAHSIGACWAFLGCESTRGGTACIAAGERLEAAQSALRARGVRFDSRGDRLRISFHLYNDEHDVAEVAGALNAAESAWRS